MIINNLESYFNSLDRLYNPITVYDEILNLISKEFNADSCIIVNENSDVLAKSEHTPEISFSSTKIKEVILTKKPKFYKKELLVDHPSQSILDNYIVSIIVLPMIDRHGKFLGALYLDRRGNLNSFSENDFERSKEIIEKLIQIWNLKTEYDILSKIGLIYRSESLKQIIDGIKKVAPTNAPVLIIGESGVGKELIAEAIHKFSARSNQIKEDINCASIHSTLIESELFGTNIGAFTEAIDKEGIFEHANKGTLFLDEIGEMSLTTQAKLLRAVENKKVKRIGGAKDIDIDIRVISATNQSLDKKIKDKTFRNDLFHRISTYIINVPPLRERREDIPPLAEHFFEIYRKEYKRFKPEPVFTDDAINKLINNYWPGNVRELKNIIERSTINYTGTKPLEAREIYINPTSSIKTSSCLVIDGPIKGNSLDELGEQTKAKAVRDILKSCNNNITHTAELLNTTRQTIYNCLKIKINE